MWRRQADVHNVANAGGLRALQPLCGTRVRCLHPTCTLRPPLPPPPPPPPSSSPPDGSYLQHPNIPPPPSPRRAPCSAIMSFVGLGSVSDYVVHHTDSPVVVIKQH